MLQGPDKFNTLTGMATVLKLIATVLLISFRARLYSLCLFLVYSVPKQLHTLARKSIKVVYIGWAFVVFRSS